MFVNGRPALRSDDLGIHTACCGSNMWQAQKGSATVFINGKSAYRLNDPSKHCGGPGNLIEGSSDVLVGDAAGGGGGSADSASSPSTASGSSGEAPGGAQGPAGAATAAQSASGPSPAAAAEPTTSPSAEAPATTPVAAPLPDHWFEVRMVGVDGKPLGGERYIITDSTGLQHRGFLDDQGRVKLFGLAAGECELAFPDLDQDAWETL